MLEHWFSFCIESSLRIFLKFFWLSRDEYRLLTFKGPSYDNFNLSCYAFASRSLSSFSNYASFSSLCFKTSDLSTKSYSLFLSLLYSSLVSLSLILSLIFGISCNWSTLGLLVGSTESIHYMTCCKSSEYLSGILSILPSIILDARAIWLLALNGGFKATIS